jgi:hypothetical protein
MFGSLVFDSFFVSGAMAGVRSISATARHLLYESSQLAIDVRVDAQNRRTAAIAGQILEAATEDRTPRRWGVTLLQKTATIAQMFTNDFGEFYFECANGPDLRIRIEAEGQQAITLILPD